MESKIKTLEEISNIVIDFRTISGIPWDEYVPGPVVTANGVFDILHPGHVFFLETAASAGDLLIVGVNSDKSTKMQNKDPQRPINDEMFRARVIAGLGCVNYVVIFDEKEPLKFLRAVRPNIHYLGEKYKKGENRIFEMDVVENELGGKCQFTTYTDNSSTNVIDKILRVYGAK